MHKAVLLQESVDALNLSPGKIYIDGTFGAGGHSREVLKRFGRKVEIIALDRDPEVVRANPDFEIRTQSFRDIDKIDVEPHAILLDLGISSDQFETSGRGFSFQRDEPLDMRMSETGPTAADILNSWDEQAIELILRGFGEERFSKKIAREIVERRSHFAKASRDKKDRAFETTADLVDAILTVKPRHFLDKIHPATKTFQALRIAVNDELDALEEGLAKGLEMLARGGRFAVISFHSLEDRIVKNFFRDKAKEGQALLITKKPTIPTDEEITKNPRSRSAKLRVIEKL